MKYPALAALGLLFCMALPATGETLLLNAESDQELRAWGQKSTSKLASLSDRFATRGVRSLRFTVPALTPSEVPAKSKRGPTISFACKKPPVTDWSAYERLVLDVVNDGEVAAPLRLTINTAAGKTDHDYLIPPGRWMRVVLPVALMNAEQTDIKRVTSVRVTGRKIDRPWEVFLDNMTLLAPGEAPPEAPDAFRREMADWLCAEANRAEQVFSGYRAGLVDRREGQVADRAAETALTELRKSRRLLEGVVRSSRRSATTDELAAQNERLDRAARTLGRVPSIVAWARACTTADTLRDRDVLVGQATSMSKILPRENPLEVAPAKELELSAARNETECAQIVVLPLRHGLRRVTARVDGDLRSTEGHALSTAHIDCDVMGYIETRNHPPYDVSFIGWWPDPILDFLGPVDVARGDAQSFWIRVRVPKDQAPGLYRGMVTLNGRGMRAVRIPFVVRVRDFAVPAVSPLPTAITTCPPLFATPEWNASLKYKWADFLADYYIGYDHLYRFTEPDFEIIDHLNRQGRLGAFNLGQFQVGKTPEGKANPEELQKMLAWTGEAYRKTKERGLIDHAYIYGFDEVKEVWFDTLEQTAAAIKKAMPGVMVMTTAKDYDFGRKGWLASIDAWCPNTQDFDPAMVEGARARGDQVWWYICTGPRHPYANIFVEYPAIEARLLMGAMTAKYRPDGFLYWQTTVWKSREPIRTGPFTNWEALSYRTNHGDGSWICMREGGLPVPTIRLENFRDGLEDYAYVRILEEAIRIKEARGAALSEDERQWLTEAKTALEPPLELVVSMTEYSHDPAALYAWRKKLAIMIEASGEQDLDPWPDGFTLRQPTTIHHGSRHDNGRVNSVAHTAFDPVKGDVDVTGQSGAITIEAVYSIDNVTTSETAGTMPERIALDKLKPVVSRVAAPFSLGDVRLLDGPFKQAMELNQQYLLFLEPDRFLSGVRQNAGLTPKASRYGGWEAQGVAGQTLGHYMTALAQQFRATGDARFRERVDYIVNELAECQAKDPTGFVAAIPNGKSIFEGLKARGGEMEGWVAWYTMHKLFQGLRDAYWFCGNEKAKQALFKLTDWADAVTCDLTEAEMQTMLGMEHGGMPEVMGDVYALSGNPKHLALARRFCHRLVMDPLARGEDRLPGLHANTQVPKIVGAARLYELTGEDYFRRVSQNFWDIVHASHTFCIGGHGESEHFFPTDQFRQRPTSATAETCGTYNMLRLTEALFAREPSARLMDYYERALFNQILGSQDPRTGMFTYFQPLKPGHFKHYSDPTNAFWCCVGTGMENHTKYGEAIYSHSADTLWVNLFIASTLNWRDKGVAVKQETQFPDSDTTKLGFSCKQPVLFTLKVRWPAWAQSFIVSVNGSPLKVTGQPGENYVPIEREWRDGDRVELRLPMKLHTEPLPHTPDIVAVLYGPIVLAAELGTEGFNEFNLYQTDHNQNVYRNVATPPEPVFVSEGDVLGKIERAPGIALVFKTTGLVKPRDLSLIPFYRMHHQRYSVYFQSLTPAGWERHKIELRAAEEQQKAFEARIVDDVKPGQQQSEVDHAFRGEHSSSGGNVPKWRAAGDGGWFEYTLKVVPDQPMELQVTYWGSDEGKREFELLVDGQRFAAEKLTASKPNDFFDKVYPIPTELTRGKANVVLRFQAKPGNTAGGVFGLRMLKPAAPLGAATGQRPFPANAAASASSRDNRGRKP